MQRDYKKENDKRTDKNITFRVFENKDYIKVSKTCKSKTTINLHPYLKEQYKLISDNLSGDFEAFIKQKIEEKLGKKIILKS